MSKNKQAISVKAPIQKPANSIQKMLVKGFEFHQKGDLISAGEIYAQILGAQPLHFDALHLSGLIAAKSGEYDAAIQLISKAISINAVNPSAYCNLGNVYLNMGKPDLAIENYSKALKLNPNNDVAYFSRVFR